MVLKSTVSANCRGIDIGTPFVYVHPLSWYRKKVPSLSREGVPLSALRFLLLRLQGFIEVLPRWLGDSQSSSYGINEGCEGG
jgi:hypothetical protein